MSVDRSDSDLKPDKEAKLLSEIQTSNADQSWRQQKKKQQSNLTDTAK